ncbi:MAG: type II toxin-antitoxin system RelB/DinJ family antitoxin [Spirochaetia bacterium]|nr:type II toxin-antitoxin system RelB/DinJ family antitoxin [Spirochaetia bacterium]
METVATNIRIDKLLKEQSSQVLESLGISISETINIILRQVILHNGISFKIEYPRPSRSLKNAIKEGERFCDYGLTGNYASHRECYVLSNLLLIYRIYKNILIFELVNTRNHSDFLENNQQCL